MTGLWLLALSVCVICGFVFYCIVRVGAMADDAARSDEAVKDAKNYRETRKRIDDEIVADDPATARRLLAERAASRQRDL